MNSAYHLERPTAVSKWCRDPHVIEMWPFPDQSTGTEQPCSTLGPLGRVEYTKPCPAEARGKFRLEEFIAIFSSSAADLTDFQFYKISKGHPLIARLRGIH